MEFVVILSEEYPEWLVELWALADGAWKRESLTSHKKQGAAVKRAQSLAKKHGVPVLTR